MVTSYTTISAISEGEYKEKGSKFLAFAHPIKSIEEAKELIKTYKKQYYDARHHCFAYCINPSNEQTRAADDGEPNNSAGAPILGQIRSFELSNVMVVVVRYFGGTKLGVSGLITAYRSAAFEALNNAKKIELEIKEALTIRFDYVDMDKVMKVVKQFDLEIIKQNMQLECDFTVKVTVAVLQEVKVALEFWLFEE